jgi:hypothetical protein
MPCDYWLPVESKKLKKPTVFDGADSEAQTRAAVTTTSPTKSTRSARFIGCSPFRHEAYVHYTNSYCNED